MFEMEIFNGIEFGIRHVDGQELTDISKDVEENPTEFHFGVLVSFLCFSFLLGVRK